MIQIAKRKRAAVSLIVAYDGRLLCVWNTRHQGWTLPGGLVEPHETAAEAQARELYEETGLSTRARRLVYVAPVVPVLHPDRASCSFVYRVYPHDVNAAPGEAGAPVRWLTFDQYLAGAAFSAFYRRMKDAGVELGPTTTLTPEPVPEASPPADTCTCVRLGGIELCPRPRNLAHEPESPEPVSP